MQNVNFTLMERVSSLIREFQSAHPAYGCTDWGNWAEAWLSGANGEEEAYVAATRAAVYARQMRLEEAERRGGKVMPPSMLNPINARVSEVANEMAFAAYAASCVVYLPSTCWDEPSVERLIKKARALLETTKLSPPIDTKSVVNPA